MSELVTQKQKMATIADVLQKRQKEIAKAIPRGLDPQRFLRVALTNFQVTPKLLDCTPASVFTCVMQAAQWGLELDPVLGQCYMVPYKTTATLIIGYRGLMEMARRHPSIIKINAKLVYAQDHLHIEYGLYPKLDHIPVLTPDRGPVVGAYCVWKLKEADEPDFLYMSREEIDDIRKRSRAANDGPWVTDFDMMALKTVLRRSSRFWPQSTDLGRMVAQDERTELGIEVPALEFESPALPATAEEPKRLADTLPPVPDTSQSITVPREGTTTASVETPAVPAPTHTLADDFQLDAEIIAREAAQAAEHVNHPSPPTIDPAAREEIRKEHDRRHEPRKAK